ncbi:hypothetical protein [Sunxiuqinia rutila]
MNAYPMGVSGLGMVSGGPDFGKHRLMGYHYFYHVLGTVGQLYLQ